MRSRARCTIRATTTLRCRHSPIAPRVDARLPQSKALLPPSTRAKLARAQLWTAKRLLTLDNPDTRRRTPEGKAILALSTVFATAVRTVRTVFMAYGVLLALFLVALTVPGLAGFVESVPIASGASVLKIPLLLFDVELSFA